MSKRKEKAKKGDTKGNGTMVPTKTKIPYEQHEFGTMFPIMSGEELNRLKSDIEENGLVHRAYLFEGKVLDGWNRLRAMSELGMDMSNGKYVDEWPGLNGKKDRDSAILYVMSQNFSRRHLTKDQKAMVLAKFSKLKRGGLSGSGSNLSRGEIASAADLAKEHDVSIAQIGRARSIEEKGTEEVKDAVRDGEIGTKAGVEIAKLPEKDQKEALNKARAPAPPPPANTKPAVHCDLVYTGTYVRGLRDADPPAKKNATWYFRVRPDELHMAFDIISGQGFEIVSFMTVTIKKPHNDPFTDGSRDLVLIATKGEPDAPDRKEKFKGVMPEQQFLEQFGKAYPDGKVSRATFFGTKPTENWQDWKGGNK